MKGFTLVETLIAIGILVLLGGLTSAAFYNKFRTVTVDKDVQNVLAYLDKARNQSLSSVNSSSFGVKFSSSTVYFFKGTTSNSSTNQASRPLSSGVTISPLALTGGVTEVYFNRLTGEPSATGTITFSSANGSSFNKTIVIRSTGLAEVQ